MAQQSSFLSLEKVILKVINRYFDVSLIMGIMLTGSRVTNKHREDSDVDVMLISKLSNRQTISMMRERNYTFQFIIVPFNKLSSMIADDYISGSFVFHSMINKGIILKDTFGILATYKEKLSKVSVQLSERVLMRTVYSINESCRYIESRHKLSLTSVMGIIKNLEQLIIKKMATSDKYVDQEMENYPKEHDAIRNMLYNYLRYGKTKTFVSAVQQMVSNMGCPSVENASSTLYLQKSVSSRECMILISGKDSIDEDISLFFISLRKQLKGVKSFSLVIGNNQYLQAGIYLSLYSSRPFTKEVYDTIHQAIYDSWQQHKLLVISPFNTFFFQVNLFGDGRAKILVYDFFCTLTRCSERYNMRARNILVAYIMMVYLFEKEPSIWEKLVIDLFQFYLPEVIDINDSLSHKLLLQRKKQVIQSYHDLYRLNKQRILSAVKLSYRQKQYGTIKLKFAKVIETTCGVSAYNSSICLHSENSALLNVCDYALSSLGFLPHEKFAIVFNTSKMIKDGDVQLILS